MSRSDLPLSLIALAAALVYVGIVAGCIALWANVALVPPDWRWVAIGLLAATVAVVAVRLAGVFLGRGGREDPGGG